MLIPFTAELSIGIREFEPVARAAVVADPAPAWAAGRPGRRTAPAPAPCRTVRPRAPYGPLEVAEGAGRHQICL